MNESMMNTIFNKVVETGEGVATMKADLKNLVDTVDDHHDLIVETRDDVKTIVSKQNQDYLFFMKEKEIRDAKDITLEGRVKSVEDYIKLRQAGRRAFFGKIYETIWIWIQKYGWVIIILMLIAVFGVKGTREIIQAIKY